MKISRSFWAFLIAAPLAVLSMGAVGAALYWLVAPLFSGRYGRFDDWSGDWVWPACILAGLLWSLSFLLAGWLTGRWTTASPWLCRLLYLLVLWAGTAIAWAIALSVLHTP